MLLLLLMQLQSTMSYSLLATPRLLALSRSLGFTQPRMQEDGAVRLLDESSGKTLQCFVAGTVYVEGTMYAALYPADAPATMGTMDDEKLTPLDPDMEAAVFPAAQSACAVVGVELMDTPVVLTVAGEVIEADMEMDAERGGDSMDDEEDEDMVVVADFAYEGQRVFVLRMLDPVYVVGRAGSDASTYVVPTDAEMDLVGSAIEELVEEIEEALDEEYDDDDEMAP